jgi:hypothetical protein
MQAQRWLVHNVEIAIVSTVPADQDPKAIFSLQLQIRVRSGGPYHISKPQLSVLQVAWTADQGGRWTRSRRDNEQTA